MAGENLVTVTDSNFEETVKKSALPVVVDFWAEWCGPCRMVAPTFEALSGELKGKLVFGKLNVDDNGQIATQFQVRSIPTFIVFQGGVEVHRLVGALGRDDMKNELNRFAKA